MKAYRYTWDGGCHCGNIHLSFSSDAQADELQVRECQCGFCRRHGVRTATDRNGELKITVNEADNISQYSHGLSVAEFYVCRRCGTYVAAVMQVNDATFATLNINTLTDNPFGQRRGAPANYTTETAIERADRRTRMWTPTTVSGT